MTLPSSGALSLNDVRGEFGGPSSNVAINSYYRNGSFVYNVTKNLNIPTSGQIQFNDFYGTEGAGVYLKCTFGTGNTGGKLPITYNGVDTQGKFSPTFGSFQDSSVTVGSTSRTARTFMSSPGIGLNATIHSYDFNLSSAITTNTFLQVYSTSALIVDFGHGTSPAYDSVNNLENCPTAGPGTSQGSSAPATTMPAGAPVFPQSGTHYVVWNKGSHV